jgi:serine/threonine-protein kinase
MTPERWDRIQELYHAARACADAERTQFLADACAGDSVLELEVRALLDQPVSTGSFVGFLGGPVQARLSDVATNDLTGRQLGSYRVLSLLGRGGMGEVYRAHDAKLDRDVAIKVLPSIFTADHERLARFESEARMLAAVNHPHIGAIYGLEDVGGMPALVLELVEGETLADRLRRGPIPPRDALTIARQIADALNAAHRKGIVHRDLKPANIKVTPDGLVKVLDFGLAKALASDVGSIRNVSQAPTTAIDATRVGMVLGTAAYMSPEQARGLPVDTRADIWAFGGVLYEMLSGRPPFTGQTVAETLAAVLEREPDWNALPTSTPSIVRALLIRCLAKDIESRLAAIRDASLEIERALGRRGRTLRVDVSRRAALAAAALAAVAVAGTVAWMSAGRAPGPVTRFTLAAPTTAPLSVHALDRSVSITPEGSRIVYVSGASAQGGRLVVRALDSLDPFVLPDLDAVRGPFLSPDGQWIGYFDQLAFLKKVAITGGSPVTVAQIDGAGPRGATWGDDDTIVFATSNSAVGLRRVPAGGGEPVVLTRPNREAGEANHIWPEFLPDSEAVLFTITSATGALADAQVAVLDVDTGERKLLLRGASHAHYVPTGHLLYMAAGGLTAAPFDLARREVGLPTPVVPDVLRTATGGGNFAVARDGTFVYIPRSSAPTSPQRSLVWVDRLGRETPINAPPRAYVYPRLSPRGTHIVLDIRGAEVPDLWMWDVVRETLSRFTFDPEVDQNPVWTADGRRVIFSSQRVDGVRALFWQAADGRGSAELLSDAEWPRVPTSVSPDGKYVLFYEQAATRDIAMLDLHTRRVEFLVRTPFQELNAEVSPDGRWLAYDSNESGIDEVYVRPFPDVDAGRWQVTTGGGGRAKWARNGRELFFLNRANDLMAVSVSGGSTWEPGPPKKILDARYFYGEVNNTNPPYEVSLDGTQFLMMKVAEGTEQSARPVDIIVVRNWFEELRRLAPLSR